MSGRSLAQISSMLKPAMDFLPLEWKDIRQSQEGQFSTGSFRITSSPMITTVIYSNLHRRSRICVMGFDLDFLVMAQIPTTI